MHETLKEGIEEILKGKGDPEDRLLQVCSLLRGTVPVYDWVGFYLVDRSAKNELVLGPFSGAPTEHTRIGFGTGICGQAASTLEVFVVDDVSRSDNYLSCSPDVKSEFVAPVLFNGELVGELDLDSHEPSAFGPKHRELLEWVAEVTAEEVARKAGFAK